MAFRNLPEMPCGPVLELHGQRKRFHVPYGLKRLLEDMTREVLRFQPENVYEFLAGFMDYRLQKKLNEEAKNQRRKSWQQHRWSWQGGSVLEPDELKEFMQNLPAPAEQINHHAVVIQAAFRGYQARKKVKEIRMSVHLDEERRKSMLAALEGKVEGKAEGEEEAEKPRGSQTLKRRNTLSITQQNATEEELHSAIIIQAAFRGMHARNEVKKLRASVTEGKRMSVAQPKTSIEEDRSDPAQPRQTVDQSTGNADQETTKPSEQVDAIDASQTEASKAVEEVAAPTQEKAPEIGGPKPEEGAAIVTPADGESKKEESGAAAEIAPADNESKKKDSGAAATEFPADGESKKEDGAAIGTPAEPQPPETKEEQKPEETKPE